MKMLFFLTFFFGFANSFGPTTEDYLKVLESVQYPGWKAGMKSAEQFIKLDQSEEFKINAFVGTICATQSGASALANIVPGFGIPLSVAVSLQFQISLATGIAAIRGYNMSDFETAAMYSNYFILGDLTAEFGKYAASEGGKVLMRGLLTQMPGRIFIDINKQAGFRLVTKQGTKGFLNMASMIPGLGMFICSAVDGAMCYSYSTAINLHTFRGKGEYQKCLADIFDYVGAMHLKKKFIEDFELDSKNFCNRQFIRSKRMKFEIEEVELYNLIEKRFCVNGKMDNAICE